MPGKEPSFGPTASTVAANVKRLRSRQGLNFKELSAELKRVAGWDISAVGVRRIEEGSRRVTVDDLMALAVTLRSNPNALLLPPTDDGQHLVAVTGSPNQTGADAWKWARGEKPLPGALSFVPDSVPKGSRYTYAEADFQSNTVPAAQNWTDQPNIIVGPPAGNDGDD
ncbi:helix-turn-helix transcriptional regulator [Nocardia rhamnosiphila]|uniref:helix-turn-helix domain-containing protein n=1 Tax=Nocardia rhamnosiphila TaxID=426716 RepID=UPI0033DE1828